MFKTVTSIVLLVLAKNLVTATYFEPNKVLLKDGLEGRGLLDGAINDTIQGILADLPEIISIADVNLNLDLAGILTGSLNFSTLDIKGVKELEIPYLVTGGLIVPESLDIHLIIPVLDLNALYSLDVLLLDLLQIYGDDSASILIENITLNITADLRLSEPEVVQNLRIIIGVGAFNANIQGVLDSQEISDTINTVLNALVAPFINTYPELVSDIISPIIQGLLNGLLAGDGTGDTTESSEHLTNLLKNL